MAQLNLLLFSLSASAILWLGGMDLIWEEWILTWVGFSAVTLIINQALTFQK
jgi:hypothetical protein